MGSVCWEGGRLDIPAPFWMLGLEKLLLSELPPKCSATCECRIPCRKWNCCSTELFWTRNFAVLAYSRSQARQLWLRLLSAAALRKAGKPPLCEELIEISNFGWFEISFWKNVIFFHPCNDQRCLTEPPVTTELKQDWVMAWRAHGRHQELFHVCHGSFPRFQGALLPYMKFILVLSVEVCRKPWFCTEISFYPSKRWFIQFHLYKSPPALGLSALLCPDLG